MKLSELIAAYLTDPDSTFRKNRYCSRVTYRHLLHRLDTDCGTFEIGDIKARQMRRWHEGWVAVSGISMAHALVGMLRTITTFGATMLECHDCRNLKITLHDMRFEMGKPRGEALSADQATIIRKQAHECGLPSIAMAQAFQFECTLRQKDVIGEWVPLAEDGDTDVFDGEEKWLRGLRWEEVDDLLILHHVTSKRGKLIEPDLKLAPMVTEELSLWFPGLITAHPVSGAVEVHRSRLPESGPILISEYSGRAWRAEEFRRKWRQLARFGGIPDNVFNMDSRAGAITEATDSGALIEDVRHAATHSNVSTTERYSRGSGKKVIRVQESRILFRAANDRP